MEAANAFLGALTALCVAVTALLPILKSLRRADAATDERIDELWTAHIQRGKVEAIVDNKVTVDAEVEGMADMAVLLRPDIRAAYEPIAGLLRGMRAEMPTATDGQLGEAIQKRLGTWLTRHICVPLRIKDFACIYLAIQVADGILLSDEVDLEG